MMQETMEKRANRTVGKSRQKDFFAVLLFFFLLPYTCSSVVRAGQEKTVETIVPVSGRTVRMQSGSDVRTMTEEAFLIGALAAVIPAEYEPEALKAQAVILRSSCVAGGHLEETVLENGTTGATQESISQNSVSAVEPRIIDSDSGFSYLDKAQRKRLWGEQADVLEGGGARFFGLCSRMAGSGCQRTVFSPERRADKERDRAFRTGVGLVQKHRLSGR